MKETRTVSKSCSGHVVSLVHRIVKTTETSVPHYNAQKTCFKCSPHPDDTGMLRPLPPWGKRQHYIRKPALKGSRAHSSISSFYKQQTRYPITLGKAGPRT